jgi:protein involved in polysaccharide export with SLBB domain
MRTLVGLIWIFAMITCAQGAAVSGTNAALSFQFEGGERVRIDLENQTTPLEQIVTPDGFVSVPTGGTVNILGQNLQQATEALTTHVEGSTGIKKPKLSIAVVQSVVHRAYIEGEVTHPQPIDLPADRTLTLAAALAVAEGSTPDADITHIKLVHRGDRTPKVEIIDASKFEDPAQESVGPVLQSGDVVIVPRSGTFTVTGEVAQPGVYSRRHIRSAPNQPMRLSQAIAVSGGAKSGANLNAVILVRTQKQDRSSTTYDVEAALERHDVNQDPALQDGDQVVVPPAVGYTILGKVHTAGAYFGKSMTVSRLIALAGGLDQFAKKSGIIVARKDEPGRTIRVDLDEITKAGRSEKDLVLYPGDIVYVGENTF